MGDPGVKMAVKGKVIYRGDLGLDIINHIAVILFTVICFYPFYYVIIYSISTPSAAAGSIYFLPVNINFITYAQILKRNDLFMSFIISILRTVLGTILSIVCSSMFAYLMTKREMMFRKFVYRFVIITMYISAGLIPWYLVMKTYGLKNNFLLYILPGAINAFYIILVKTYIEQLPASLEESASIDGAGFLAIFSKIIFPLSKPIIATIAVFCSVGQWNTWVDNYLLVAKKNLQTLQLILFTYLNQAEEVASSIKSGLGASDIEKVAITPTSVQMVIIVITVFPIMIVYPFLQKYFAKGIMIGAIKG
jgi:putative aldouronate transport system permease protein